ncbi:MAG: hypothetical protein EOM87_08575 [Clostridia bacterium]|nr:hypothetical protein [Clostridia bacterium]
MEKNNFLQKYTVFDLVLIAMLTAITVAFKAIAGELVRLITGPLGIPGGALAGGLYMLWLPLVIALINKRGAALLISLVQSIVLLITGLPGGHGIWTFLTYLAPALAVELIMLIKGSKEYNILHFIYSVIIANIIGTFGSNLVFFRISLLPLMFTLAAAALSGALGGIIGYFTFVKVKDLFITKNSQIKQQRNDKEAKQQHDNEEKEQQ